MILARFLCNPHLFRNHIHLLLILPKMKTDLPSSCDGHSFCPKEELMGSEQLPPPRVEHYSGGSCSQRLNGTSWARTLPQPQVGESDLRLSLHECPQGTEQNHPLVVMVQLLGL